MNEPTGELRDSTTVAGALRASGAVREFTDDVVTDSTLYDILDDARFAPSGGNRQPWRVIVLRDADQRRLVAETYLEAWHDYVGHVLAGLVPFAPTATAQDRLSALERRGDAVAKSDPRGFAETLADAPALLLVTVDLSQLAATDRDLPRYTFVGGASVYPFVWNVLLAAQARGLGGVMTTVATRLEDRLRPVLKLDDNDAVAAMVVLGYPRRRVARLTRRPVERFTTLDTRNGPALEPNNPSA